MKCKAICVRTGERCKFNVAVMGFCMRHYLARVYGKGARSRYSRSRDANYVSIECGGVDQN